MSWDQNAGKLSDDRRAGLLFREQAVYLRLPSLLVRKPQKHLSPKEPTSKYVSINALAPAVVCDFEEMASQASILVMRILKGIDEPVNQKYST
jgi:hypothetical protein